MTNLKKGSPVTYTQDGTGRRFRGYITKLKKGGWATVRSLWEIGADGRDVSCIIDHHYPIRTTQLTLMESLS